MPRNDADQEWDKHTDEIRSIDSDELHETRPNRWTGPGSTWRKLTAEDRSVYAAIENLRHRDLSLHLYNAFALKRGGGPGGIGRGPGVEDVDRSTGMLARREGEWKPDRSWTAWPLGLDRVPECSFMERGSDEDGERETFRRRERREGFARDLEEEVGALMLRLGKEKFRARGLGEEEERTEEEGEEVVPSIEKGEESDVSMAQIKGEPLSGVEQDDEVEAEDMSTGATSEPRRKKRRKESPVLVPTVAVDDEVSYELLRPLTRHLLTKLDRTLTVLHNARVAGIDFGSESDEPLEEKQSPIPRAPRSPKRKIWRGEDSPPPERRTSPKLDLHTPLEGETVEEMRLRLARKYHRRIPRPTNNEGETTAGDSRRSPRKTTARVKMRSMSTAAFPGKNHDTDIYRGERLDNWTLRDWRDVLGAAALAGFSPSVIARTTQRCADLFGQEMEFNTLAEEPAATSRGKGKSRSTRYVPGEPPLPTSDEEDDEESAYQSEVEQIRAVSRASSVIIGSSSDEEATEESVRTTPAPRGRARRSTGRGYSVGPSVVRLYCPHPTCSGAINGFTRRYNLKQHLVTIHGKQADSLLFEDEDDADELHGAVHVDGFLKPIRPRKGWRASDVQPSARRKSRRKTRAGDTPPPRQFYSDAGYQADVNDDDLVKREEEQDYV